MTDVEKADGRGVTSLFGFNLKSEPCRYSMVHQVIQGEAGADDNDSPRATAAVYVFLSVGIIVRNLGPIETHPLLSSTVVLCYLGKPIPISRCYEIFQFCCKASRVRRASTKDRGSKISLPTSRRSSLHLLCKPLCSLCSTSETFQYPLDVMLPFPCQSLIAS
jgi:hypothetical protein